MSSIEDAVLELASRGDYDTALDRIASLGQKLCAADLVQQGRYILLSSGGIGRTPDDAQKAFERALELDADHVPALTELGWLHYSVHDDAATGKSYFDRALDAARLQWMEAFRGAVRCVDELAGVEARNDFVQRAASSFELKRMEDIS